jgi:hypothetical protein
MARSEVSEVNAIETPKDKTKIIPKRMIAD